MLIENYLGLITVLVSWLWLRQLVAGGRLLMPPTFLGVLFLFHFLTQILPAVSFLYDPMRPMAQQYFWSMVLAAFLMPVGALLAHFAMSSPHQADLSIFQREIKLSRDSSRVSLIFLVGLGAICMAILFSYISKVPSYPLRALLLEAVTDQDAMAQRMEATTSNFGYIYGLAQAALFPWLFGLGFAEWRFRRDRMDRLLILGLAAAALFYNSYTAAKAPVVLLFVIVLGLTVLRYSANKAHSGAKATVPPLRKWITIIALSGIAIGFPVAIFKQKTFGKDLTVTEIIFEGVMKRVFLKPAINTYYAFEIFPKKMDYTLLMDNKKIAQLVGGEYIKLSGVVANYKGMISGSNAPPTTVGRFHAEGGLVAVTLGTLFMSFVFQTLQLWMGKPRHDRSPVYDVTYVFILWGAFRVSMGTFSSVLLTEAILPAIFLFSMHNFLTRLRIHSVPAGPPAIVIS